MAEVKRPTTTISTIAIRAGESTKIVVAVLKSVNWVQLRIDEMHPRMLEIGRSANDTARLLDIHTDLMERLKSKQEQIEELLAQADRLVTEQQEPEVAVYEAMADSLGSAWKDLNRQLQLRGNLLEETLRFHELAVQHDHIIKHLNGKLSSGVPTYGTADDMRRFAAEFEQARKDLIDVTALAMDSGASIIGQTRVLGMMVDNPERPREIVDTCQQIEEVMLRLAEQWKTMEGEWETEQSKVEAKEETTPLWRDLEVVEKWLDGAQQEMERLSSGADASQASQRFDHLFTDAKQQQSTLRRVSQSAERLIGNAESGQLTDRCVNLKRRFDEFLRELETRRKNALEVAQFFQSANAVLNQLNSMEGDIRNANAAMAGELGPLARQKADPILSQGRSLSHRLGSSDAWTVSIDHKTSEIEQKLTAIESLAASRGREVEERFRSELLNVQSWLSQSAETFLASNGNMGDSLPQAAEFVDRHKDFATEIMNKDADVFTLLSRSKELGSNEKSQVGEFHRRYEQLKQTLEGRVQIGTLYQQFHKFAKEMNASFDSLDSLLVTNRGISDQRLANQMTQVFRMVQETLTQAKHQGEKFVSLAKAVGTTDNNLQVDKAVDCVRRMLNEHEHRISKVSHSWQEWKQAQENVERINNVIEEIEEWIQESWEIIHTLEKEAQTAKTSEEAARLATRVENFKQQQRLQEEKIRIIEETAKKLHFEEHDHRLEEVKRKYKEIVDRMYQFANQMITVTETLRKRETVEQMESKIEAPIIVAQLRDAQVDEGQRFEMSARIEGQPEPAIQWLKDGIDVSSNSDYLTTYLNCTASLRIDETFVDDSGLYTVKATSPAGQVQSSARLTVKSRSQMQAEIDENKPRFAKQLKNVSVTEGETATFDCVVVGQPEPEVIWYREEVLIRESSDIKLSFVGDHCSLTLRNTVPQDSGLYKVTARNTLGEATSFCRLNVQAVARAPQRAPSPPHLQIAPSFAPALHNQTLTEGQRCMFEVRATGEPAPTVVWKFNNQQLVTREEIQVIEAQNGYHRLVIDRVGKEHAGIYSVEAVNATGEAKSVATLVVSFPPAVVQASRFSKSITPVQQTPTPPPKVQQQFDRYDTTRVVEEYLEKDIQELGISPSATAPEFVRQFQAEYRVEINEKIRMECLLVGNPRPKVQWLFNSRPIVPNSGFCQLTNVGDTYAIILNPTRPEHQGTYQLIAENIRGRTECSTVVTVTEQTVRETRESSGEAVAFYRQQEKRTIKRPGHPPHFTQTLVSVVAGDGEAAKFEGVVTGTPTPEVVWTKDGEPISPHTHRDIRFSNIGGRVSLQFANARTAHSGKYMCTAKNECGVATSSAQLVIRPHTVAPDFIQRLISKEVAEGDSLRWEVRVTGDPTPTVTWLRDGQPIPNCDEVRLITEGDGRHTLHIVKVEMADCGQFTCLAENSAGEARSTADLVVRPFGTEPGHYFHVTKVTQERQVGGQEVSRNQAFSIEQPVATQVKL